MAKGKTNKSSDRQTPVARVVQRSNSNNPAATTRTVTPINGATRKEANAAVAASERRNPDKPKDHWSNADFGKRFGSGDISRLQEGGYNTNQIMKIAQMAFSGGGDNINKINKTNQSLYNLGQQAMTPSTYQVRNIGSGGSTARNFFPGQTRRRVMGWTGFGSPMTVNTLGTSDEGPKYTQSSVWNLPSSFSGMTTRSPMTGSDPSGLDQSQGTTSGTTMPTADEVTEEMPEELSKESEQPFLGDYSDLFSTATNFRTPRSSRRRAGSRAQGFGSQTIAPQYASNVGINYG